MGRVGHREGAWCQGSNPVQNQSCKAWIEASFGKITDPQNEETGDQQRIGGHSKNHNVIEEGDSSKKVHEASRTNTNTVDADPNEGHDQSKGIQSQNQEVTKETNTLVEEREISESSTRQTETQASEQTIHAIEENNQQFNGEATTQEESIENSTDLDINVEEEIAIIESESSGEHNNNDNISVQYKVNVDEATINIRGVGNISGSKPEGKEDKKDLMEVDGSHDSNNSNKADRK
ncbi:hypothetical protein RDI58_010828 [Solanum bulbocastanum]|uniref:Uncharacterized protein n=1 Tax=Solanum bulbocastanum TaxID=147425 RepID=A0AAN8TUJ1_SOLBU